MEQKSFSCISLIDTVKPALAGLATVGMALFMANAAGAAPSVGGSIAVEVLTEVRPATSAKDLTRLGDQFFEGKDFPQDMERAASHYGEAALLGEPKAMMRYGEALLLGRGVPADPARGVMFLQKAADLGNASAALVLADVYAQGGVAGIDRTQSIVLYERAAQNGRDLALVKLAQVYSQGEIVPADPVKAVAYYRQAVKAGRKDAMLALGAALTQRKFGRIGTRAEGLALLEEASRQGQDQAVIHIADSYFNGHGVRRNPDKAMKVLIEAWDSGNPRAGLRLLSIYRDGRKGAVKRSKFLAEYYFRRVAHVITEDELKMETILLQASKVSGKRQLEEIHQELGQIQTTYKPIALRKMRITNPNAYVYLLQVRLRELDFYDGHATGLLTRKTAQAIHRYCLSVSKADLCRKGPMSGDVAATISAAF